MEPGLTEHTPVLLGLVAGCELVRFAHRSAGEPSGDTLGRLVRTFNYGSRGGVTFNGLLLRDFRKDTISEISEKLLPSSGSTSSGMPSGVVVGTPR